MKLQTQQLPPKTEIQFHRQETTSQITIDLDKEKKDLELLAQYNQVIQKIENDISLRTQQETKRKELLEILGQKLDSYPNKITDQLKQTNQCVEDLQEQNLILQKDLFALQNKYNEQNIEIKDIQLRLINTAGNIHQIHTTMFSQKIMIFWGFLGIGTSLALIYYLWHYTNK